MKIGRWGTLNYAQTAEDRFVFMRVYRDGSVAIVYWRGDVTNRDCEYPVYLSAEAAVATLATLKAALSAVHGGPAVTWSYIFSEDEQ